MAQPIARIWPATLGADDVSWPRPGTPPSSCLGAQVTILPARTISYRQLGGLADLADPATDLLGAQAAGSACARQPRGRYRPATGVVRADGPVGGYGWGVPRKAWL